jgi:hypothetical protein
MNNNEEKIIDFFNSVELKAEKIPESSEETPDFLIDDGNDRILIELKTKTDSDDLKEQMNNSEKIETFTPLTRRNRLSAIIKKASHQLDAQKKKSEATFCFVFFLVEGIYSNRNSSQIQTTLYGDKEIIDQNGCNIKRCYYYTHSDFFNHRNILDGAFIFTEKENGGFTGRVCINDLSPNKNNVIKTNFINKFKPGIVNPNELESSGKVFILDAEIDRNDEEKKIEYLKEKYKLSKIIPFNYPEVAILSKI